MDIRLLGPVEAVEGEQPRSLGGTKQRALLAILALERGRVVSTTAIIDGLWGDEPPPTAQKTVQVFVSRLRRSLGEGVLVTRPGGYALDAVSCDLERFEELLERGRSQLSDGDAAAAAKTLRAALELWRGPPLADLDGEPVAAAEAPRLEELRLAALEDRIDADVAAGRHTEVVPELERLVVQHPLRERPRAALMLALHGSGRTADALAVYRDWRRVLDDELGLAPSPAMRALEQRILDQDPALEAPRRADHPRAPATRARLRLGAPVLVAAAVVVLAAALLSRGGGGARPPEASADAVLALDPVSGAVRGSAPTGSAPVAVSVGAGAVWVADAGDRTLAKVDPRTDAVVARFGLSAIPSQVVATGAAVWIANPLGNRGSVTRIDPGSGAEDETTTVRVGDDGDGFAPPTPSALAVGEGAVWTNRVRSKLARLGGGGQRTIRDLGPAHSVDGIAVGYGAVWVASSADDRLLRVDPRSMRVTEAIHIAGRPGARVAGPLAVAMGGDAVWVADAIAGTVSRVSPSLAAVTATISVGPHPTRIAAGANGVWVLTQAGLVRIDPSTSTVTRRIALTGVTSLASGAGRIWVTRRASGLAAARPVPAPVAPLRPIADSCRVVRGPAGATVTVVSELPTNNGGLDSASVADARAAMRMVLRRARFRAGRFTIAYQECDDSTRRDQSPTPERCAADATAYAAQPSLIGLVGPLTSSCAGVELPQLDGARSGPIPVVAPLTTYVGRTEAGPATAADEPQRYYPAGVRNFVRLVGADDRQALAIAVFVRGLGARRIAILDDGDGTGYAVRRYLETAAARFGLQVVRTVSWRVGARSYRALAAGVAAARPQAIVITGCFCTGGFAVIRDLRRVLGSGMPIVGTDNMSAGDQPLPRAVARAIAGTYVTDAGAPPEATAGDTLTLVRAVAHGRRLAAIDQMVPQAATAMQTLLDAIGRSDGSRAGVLRALRASGRFDAAGDPRIAPFGVYRYDPSVPYAPSRRIVGLRFVRTVVAPG